MTVPVELDIVELVRRGALPEAERRISTLIHALHTSRRETLSLQQRIDALERELELRNAVSFDGQFYWTGDGRHRQGPYCPTCYDAERVLLQLQFRTVEEIDYDTGYTRPGSKVFYKCNRCSKKSIREVAP
jgi:hypothetical protein